MVELVPAVEAQRVVVKAERSIIVGYSVKYIHDCELEKRPNVLASVPMDVSKRQLAHGVGHGLVRQLRGMQRQVGSELMAGSVGAKSGTLMYEVGD